MALDNIPDYSIKAQVPMAAIIQAYQQKAAQEQQNKIQQQQMEMQKFDHTLSVFKSASDITRSLIDQSKIKQQQDALNSLSTLFANGQQPVQTGVAPTGTANLMSAPSPAASGPSVQTGAPTEAPLSSTPDYKFQLASLMTKANPSAFTANLADDVSKSVVSPSAPAIRPSNFDIQRVDIPGKGPLTVKVDKVNNKIYDLAGNDITATAAGAAPYAPPMIITDQEGNPALAYRTPGAKATKITTPANEETNQHGVQELFIKAPKVGERVQKIVAQADPSENPVLKTTVEAATAAAAVKTILEDPDPSSVGLNSLGFYFARASGSNSQLSDAEREIFAEPLGLIDKWKNKGYKVVAGDLSPKMRTDLKKLASLIERRNAAAGEKILNTTRKRAKNAAGSYWNDSINSEIPSFSDLVATSDDMAITSPTDKPSLDQIFGGL